MLAVITVTSSADNSFPDGEVTLREAIVAANTNASVDGSAAGNGTDTIHFSAALSGDTITLGGTELAITEALTIDALALASNVTIDANSDSRIFNITATSGDFTLAGLTLTGGKTIGDNANGSDTTFRGGAIRSLTIGNLSLNQTAISGNSTTGSRSDGGGIFASSSVMLTNSTVSDNSTAGSRADGGGIRSFGAITLTSSTITKNSTTGSRADGGGIYSVGAVTLTNSTVDGNSTTGNFADGGGISSTSSVILTKSTVSGNSTAGNFAHGGGIFSFGTVMLTGSTLTDNHVIDEDSIGGGIWNNFNPITITHSILAGNTDLNGSSPDIAPGSGTFSVNFSLLGSTVSPDAGGTGNIFNDSPLLAALADNGGPTETRALLAGSLAINAGDPNIAFNPAEFDQRGAPFARVFSGRIDIGAFEVQNVAPVNSADFDSDGDIDGADFLAWQRGLGTLAPNATPANGDANGDQTVDATDLAVWQNQFGQPTPVSAVAATQANGPVVAANLVDAVMAIDLSLGGQVEEAPLLDLEEAHAETYADHFFATERIAPAALLVEKGDQPETNSNDSAETEALWLTEELLGPVFD